MENSLMQSIEEVNRWAQENGASYDDLVVDQLPAPEMNIKGKTIISFCSNNYFGLSKRSEVLSAAREALDVYGIGTCESRRLGGNLQLLEDLEQKIAEFKNGDSAVIFATGLMTNLGVVPALTDFKKYYKLFFNYPDDEMSRPVILGDHLNHRSIQMGVKLSNAESMHYNHVDLNDLENKLEQVKGREILLITDSVFSMDGDLAPLDRIVELAKRYNALLMIDDAHGSGIYGKNGRGVGEYFNVLDEIDVHMGTFSKTFGGLGGFVVANKEIVQMVKNTSSTYYFTSSLPAEQAAGLIAAIDIVKNEPQLKTKIWENVQSITLGIKRIGLNIPDRWSHIIPIIIGDDETTRKAEEFLLERGILCSSVHPPAVKSGKSRLRITVNATHTSGHIDQLLGTLDEMSSALHLPKVPMTEGEVRQEFGELPG